LKRFTLNSQNADAWRGLLISGACAPSIEDCSNVTLVGASELFATAISLQSCSDLFAQIERRANAGDALWYALLTEWRRQQLPQLTGDIHGTRRFEFFRLLETADKTSDQFSLFLERFCRSMKLESFPRKFANALAKVGDEMADNVVQHSSTSEPFSGIAGYHVAAGRAGFVVIDVGRGILARLRDSPKWSHLENPHAALHAIVSQGASSRLDQGAGEGFKQLFSSLVDHNCLIRLRTDDSVLTVAEGQTDREGGELLSPQLAGVQISISCAIGKPAAEAKLSLD
jgi:hypothetical protein